MLCNKCVYHLGGGLAFGRGFRDVCSSSRTSFELLRPDSRKARRVLRTRRCRREPKIVRVLHEVLEAKRAAKENGKGSEKGLVFLCYRVKTAWKRVRTFARLDSRTLEERTTRQHHEAEYTSQPTVDARISREPSPRSLGRSAWAMPIIERNFYGKYEV